jgi:hypothetical protein
MKTLLPYSQIFAFFYNFLAHCLRPWRFCLVSAAAVNRAVADDLLSVAPLFLLAFLLLLEKLI